MATSRKTIEKKIIGILGGMGPAATAHFYSQLVRLSQDKYGAKEDCDFPSMVLYSLPLDELTEEGVLNAQMDSIKRELLLGIKKLEILGSDFIVVPCNTVHYFLDFMQKQVDVPVLSIIEETVNRITVCRCERVGILGTRSTLRWKLYAKALKKHGIELIVPNEKQQAATSKIIYHVQEGSNGLWDKKVLENIAENFAEQEAEGVILGCTELSLAAAHSYMGIRTFDTGEILAEAALAYAMPTHNYVLAKI